MVTGVGGLNEALVFRDMEEDGLGAVAEHDHESFRLRVAQLLEEGAEPTCRITRGDQFIEAECAHVSDLRSSFATESTTGPRRTRARVMSRVASEAPPKLASYPGDDE